MRTHYLRFILIVLLPILLLLPAGITNWVFLHNVGELTPIEEIVEIQQRDGGLYGTALHPNVYSYKLELYAARRPEIVAIGSSRVLQFRQHLFSRPFVNLGRTVNYPAEAVKLVDDMLAVSTPELVIFGIDHYWLNPSFTTALDFSTHKRRGGRLTPDALITPFRWLIDDKISTTTYWTYLSGTARLSTRGAPMIGVQAILEGAGFAADGSWHYDNIVYGRRPADDPGFRNTLRRITTGSGQFRHGQDIDGVRLGDLREAISRLTDAGVRVITLVPPMAGPVRESMNAAETAYAYAQPARAAIASLGIPHGDHLDGSSVGITDCEFVDGFHVGEIGSARLLAALATLPGHALAPYIDQQEIDRMITAGSGLAAGDIRYRRDGEREIDFLQLGCSK